MKLIYKYERPLFYISLVISLIAWAFIAYDLCSYAKTLGVVIAIGFMGFLLYLFTQAFFICQFKGAGVLVSAEQFPDLNEKIKACAQKLDLKKIPATYVTNGNGVFNAFATHFMRRYYVVLMSSIVDAMQDNPDGLNFYIGHEFGHIRRKHALWHTILLPSTFLPLLGAAYHRAREYTCDLHGLACCENPASAPQALAVLAAGRRWKDINIKAYTAQTDMTRGFWMSFYELLSSYPWLTKRVACVAPSAQQDIPRRNLGAWILAVFIPRPSVEAIVVVYILLLVGGILQGQSLVAKAKEKHAMPDLSEQMPAPSVAPSIPPAVESVPAPSPAPAPAPAGNSGVILNYMASPTSR